MTQKFRAAIFWLLVVAFLFVVPLLLGYTLGYSYDWANKKIVQTGLFYFKSSPKNTLIFINEKYRGKTPKLIKHLLPRNYFVTLRKNGFHPWQKELSVKSGLATEVRHILLVRQNPPLEFIRANVTNFVDYFFPENKEKNLIVEKFLKNDFKPAAISYRVFKNRLFYLSPPNYILYEANLDGSDKKQISLDPLPADIYQLIFSGNGKIAAIASSSSQALYLLNEEKKFDLLAEGAISAQFSEDNKKMLWQTPNEIWIYWLEDEFVQPYRKANDKEFVTRFGEKIKQTIWYETDNRHIIFIVGETIKIIELDGRGQRNLIDFLTIKNPQIFFKDKFLYILSEASLYKTKIGE